MDQLREDQADLDNWQVSIGCEKCLASLLDNSHDHVEKMRERELNYLVRFLQDTVREPSSCFNQESNRSIPSWSLRVHKVVKVEGQQRSEIILNVLVKWSMVLLHLSSSEQQAKWVVKLLHFIRDWQMKFPGRTKKNTQFSWGWFTVIYQFAISPLCPPMRLWEQIFSPLFRSWTEDNISHNRGNIPLTE